MISINEKFTALNKCVYLTVNWPLPCSALDRINPWSLAKGRLNLNQSPCLYSDFKVWFPSYIVHKTSRRCNENANELNRMLAVNSLVTELWNWHMLLRGTDVETTVQKEEGGNLSTIPLWFFSKSEYCWNVMQK